MASKDDIEQQLGQGVDDLLTPDQAERGEQSPASGIRMAPEPLNILGRHLLAILPEQPRRDAREEVGRQLQAGDSVELEVSEQCLPAPAYRGCRSRALVEQGVEMLAGDGGKAGDHLGSELHIEGCYGRADESLDAIWGG
jgi:hypothetical protein